jgi:hypothetical protein
MAKKSGSKSSRSERRAGRKRAERAVQHGLPTRQQPPPRARAATPEPGRNDEGIDRSSDAPRVPVAKPGGIPTLVKVLGAALVILGGVYLLSRQRDEALTESQPAPEPPVVATSAAPAVGVPAEASPPAPEVIAAPEPPAAILSVTPPAKPVVVAPVVAAPIVSAPSKPKVHNAAVAPARPPGAVAAPGAVPVPSPPAPVTAPAASAPPKPAAPKPPPVDNPY